MTTKEGLGHVIDPEIPDTPEGKRELLGRCLAVIAAEGLVIGVNPLHVSQEGMQMIKRAQNAAHNKRIDQTIAVN